MNLFLVFANILQLYLYFFTIVYPRVPVYKSMHVNAGAQKPKEGIEFPDPGVVANCELPSLSVETETRVPHKIISQK